jgi:outer membrane protein assembly factor BamB
MDNTVPETLAVVPLLVNTGVVIVPAILAAVGSALAMLFKPRELVRTARRKPWTFSTVVACIAAVVLLIIYWPAGGGARAQAGEFDWIKIAQQMLRAEVAYVEQPPQREAKVFRGDFSRRGYDGTPPPVALDPGWAFNKKYWMFLSSPLVAANRLYGAGVLLDFGRNYGCVFCLDARTGEVVWETDTLEGEEIKGFFSSPALTADGKYLLIGQGLHFDRDSDLICLEAATGKLHWRVRTPLHIEGSVAVRGDMVVAGAGAIEDPQNDNRPIGNPGFVLAVRISDGEELWRFSLADPESSPAVGDDGTVYIGSGYNGREVVALRSETDEALARKGLDRVIWRRPTPNPATGAITLIGEMVLIGTGKGDYVNAAPDPSGEVIAMDRKTGDVLWTAKMPDAVLAPVAARDDMLVCPVRNGRIAALDPKTGKPLWPAAVVSGGVPVLAGAALAGDYIYAVSNDGYLAVLQAADGKVITKVYLNDEQRAGEMGMCVSSPFVAAGRVYVGSETGGLRCFGVTEIAR